MKKNATLSAIILFISSAVFYSSCKKENSQAPSALVEEKLVLPSQTFDYNVAPIGPAISPPVIENEIATLGRVLFYDKILSVNNTVACASCHKQELAFSDNRAFSIGFTGRNTLRNAMPIFNTFMGSQSFFWDVRTGGLENMVLQPAENHIEMGFDATWKIVYKIQQSSYYPDLFKKAFGIEKEQITDKEVRTALAEFIRSMISGNSGYDMGIQNNFANYTAEELAGLNLYRKLHCQGCHQEGAFKPSGWGEPIENIGLDLVYKDKGAEAFAPQAEGYFKVPSLRNVELTAPYMHDGRFNTLEEVIEHYNSRVQPHQFLSWHLRDLNTGQPKKLNLSAQDKKNLVAFLKTLTDHDFISAERFSNPFKPGN